MYMIEDPELFMITPDFLKTLQTKIQAQGYL